MTTLEAARVVATDLDGTLLRTDGTLSARSVRALGRACAAGARVVLVTARPPRTVEAIMSAAGLADGLAICSNGAVVYHLGRRALERVITVESAVAAEAARTLIERMPEIVWSVETGLELVRGPGWSSAFSHDVAQAAQVNAVAELWRHPVVKLLAWSSIRSADEMLMVARGVGLDGVEVTHSGGLGGIEICAAGVSKARALADLCEGWRVAAGEVAAFGDMPNDVPLLNWAGRSWAVANAHPEAIAAARDITAGNSEDGVAIILEQMYP